MYLSEMIVRNSGPLTSLDLTPAFHADGSPKPIVLVCPKGSGKTTVLSLVTDALIEFAATHFLDAAPAVGVGHRYYRLLGSSTVRQGASFELGALKFVGLGQERRLVGKAGLLPGELRTSVIESYPELGQIADEATAKIVSQPQAQIEREFRDGAYVYFPGSRSELPSWSTEQTVESPGNFGAISSNQLRKPVVVEQALAILKPWLIDLILDASIGTSQVLQATDLATLQAEASQLILPIASLNNVNSILQATLKDPGVYVARTGRLSGDRKIVIAKNGSVLIPTLDSLSAGQAGLFSMFSTIVRYGDAGRTSRQNHNIEGIVCIDELDSHLHPELQFNVLPALIAMFPRVQFIISSHSPLFPLGMKARLGEDGFSLINMPEGQHIAVERYEDFLNAFQYFEQTATFESRIEAIGRSGVRPIVLCEGETDPQYVRAAARVLGYERLVNDVEFDWVGANVAGVAHGGGKNNLNDAWKFLSNNPALVNRTVVLLYDADARKPDADSGTVHVRSMTSNPENNRAAGVENLLPVSALEEKFYRTEEAVSGTTLITKKVLDKAALCTAVCQAAEPAMLEGFRRVLEVINDLVSPPASDR